MLALAGRLPAVRAATGVPAFRLLALALAG
jgi:hypothetical protein